MKLIMEIIDPNNDLLLYHGSPNIIKKFSPGIIFLADDPEEAESFGKGSHILGSNRKVSYLYTVGAKTGKTYNGSDTIDKFITEEEDDLFGEYDDLDKWIAEIYAPHLRKKGFRYLTFYHPSFHSSRDIVVYVPLYPEKDLYVVDEERI